MSASSFDSKNITPNNTMLADELGVTNQYVDKIALFIKSEFGDLTHEWKFYGQKSGWVLKLLHKQRNILFIIPCKGFFRVAFTFGAKAANEVMASKLPDYIKYELSIAKKYSEGQTIQLEITTEEQAENVLHLIQIKLRN